MPLKSCALILSSSYISTAQVAEFGLLPPSFLCLANRRLYEWQIQSFPKNIDVIYLTLPIDFKISAYDLDNLAKRNVRILRIQHRHSLGRAVQDALAQLPKTIQELWLLHGDTLLMDFQKLPLHGISTGHIQEHANWGYCVKKDAGGTVFDQNLNIESADKRSVISGGFHFTCQTFKQSLKESKNDFIKAISIYSQKKHKQFSTKELKWFDFGHLHSAFRSRQAFTTERSFNSLRIEKRRVSKYSQETTKILAEAAWYESVPRDLDVFLPNYLGRMRGKDSLGYATEYLYLNPISDLFVFGRLPEYVWQQIFAGCKEFLEACMTHASSQRATLKDARWLYEEKTRQRLAKFSTDRKISLDKPWTYNGRLLPALNKIFSDVLKAIPRTTKAHISLTHGDFHPANIFFDFRSLCIKAVDPRGLIKDEQTVYGDRRYDLAKLSHSINGLYDFIVAGILDAKVHASKHMITYNVRIEPQIQEIQQIFNRMIVGGISPNSREIKAIVIILFLSMLPLHADHKQRQDTLLANVFRLYEDFLIPTC